MSSRATKDKSFLTLINENWLGVAGPKKHTSAVRALADALKPLKQTRFKCVASEDNKNRRHGVDYYEEIVAQLSDVGTALRDAQPTRLMNLGCDCGTEYAPVAHLLSRYGKQMAVVWFDAHGDLNTPTSPTGGSHSGHFHGMVLRALTGHQSFGFSHFLDHSLSPDQIIMAGCRELDPDEEQYIAAENISLIPPQNITKKSWLDTLNAFVERGITHIYIHIDFDVLDPEEFPWVGCPTPGGISIETLRLALAQIYERFDVVGLSAVEISADGEDAMKAAFIVKDIFAALNST